MGFDLRQALDAIYDPNNGLTMHERLVMICLSIHAHETGTCQLNIRTIARECSITDRDANHALHGLLKKGWIGIKALDKGVYTIVCRLPGV